jgi:hypothetical protein
LDGRAEALDGERSVVEVRSQRGHDAEAAVGRGDGPHHSEEEGPLFSFAREGEQLLELVDHQQQLALVRHQVAEHAVDAVLAAGELVDQSVRVGHRDMAQALGQLLERG